MTTLAVSRPFNLEDIKEGQSIREEVEITADLLQAFIDVSGDRASAHIDEQHAREMGYQGRLAHGFLVSLPYSRMLGMSLPGPNTVIHQIQFDALAPVYVGDRLTYEVEVQRVIPAVKTVVLKLTAHNQEQTLVNRGRSNCTFRR